MIPKSFRLADLRRLYWQAGVQNRPTVFLFNDTQVVEEGFLEDINNILSSGEVPNLYKPEEFEEVSTCHFFMSFPQNYTIMSHATVELFWKVVSIHRHSLL